MHWLAASDHDSINLCRPASLSHTCDCGLSDVCCLIRGADWAIPDHAHLQIVSHWTGCSRGQDGCVLPWSLTLCHCCMFTILCCKWLSIISTPLKSIQGAGEIWLSLQPPRCFAMCTCLCTPIMQSSPTVQKKVPKRVQDLEKVKKWKNETRKCNETILQNEKCKSRSV